MYLSDYEGVRLLSCQSTNLLLGGGLFLNLRWKSVSLSEPAVSAAFGAGVTDVQTWDAWILGWCCVPSSSPHDWAASALELLCHLELHFPNF